MITLSVEENKKSVFYAVKKASINLDIEVLEESYSKGRIYLKNRGNLLSFGNDITIKINNSESKKCLLTISSQSAASFQIIDWGVNDDLENMIYNEIIKILQI